MEVLAGTTGEAWEKLSFALLESEEETMVHKEPVMEIRWLSIARAHFDTNAIEFIQSNVYGLTELQRVVAGELGVIDGTYHHFIDSLFVSKKHFVSFKETLL